MDLQNHLIITAIFRHLDHPNLLNARLVCSTWASEGAKHIGKTSKVLVRVHPAHEFSRRWIDPDPDLEEVANFLVRNRIRHTLLLSLVQCPWIGEYDCDQLEVWGDNRIDTSFGERVVPYLQRTGALIPSARIEVSLCGEDDVKLFRAVMSSLTQLRALQLESVHLKVQYAEEFVCVPATLKSLAIRIQNPPEICAVHHIPEESPECLKLFDNVEFVAEIGWESFHNISFRETLFYAMREDIEEYPDSFRAVRGVKLEIKRRVTARLLKELPRPLSHIYITVTDCTSADLDAILLAFSQTLISFNVDWRCKSPGKITHHDLPNLRQLRICEESDDMESCDLFNLRYVFLAGLERLMPSLSSLAIIMKDSKTWDLVWTDIFPHLDSTGERMVIPQIEELSISMVEDCDAAKIHRIQAIFPKLKKFCHFGEAENPELLPAVRFIPDPDRDPQILFVCRHDKHCRPRRDWWLDKKHAKRFCFYDYFANFENDLGYDV